MIFYSMNAPEDPGHVVHSTKIAKLFAKSLLSWVSNLEHLLQVHRPWLDHVVAQYLAWAFITVWKHHDGNTMASKLARYLHTEKNLNPGSMHKIMMFGKKTFTLFVMSQNVQMQNVLECVVVKVVEEVAMFCISTQVSL